VVASAIMLLPLLVTSYCYWLMATIDVAAHNGHDHHDCKQLLIDDLEKMMCSKNKSEQGIRA
jgi:hypothetical protein